MYFPPLSPLSTKVADRGAASPHRTMTSPRSARLHSSPLKGKQRQARTHMQISTPPPLTSPSMISPLHTTYSEQQTSHQAHIQAAYQQTFPLQYMTVQQQIAYLQYLQAQTQPHPQYASPNFAQSQQLQPLPLYTQVASVQSPPPLSSPTKLQQSTTAPLRSGSTPPTLSASPSFSATQPLSTVMTPSRPTPQPPSSSRTTPNAAAAAGANGRSPSQKPAEAPSSFVPPSININAGPATASTPTSGFRAMKHTLSTTALHVSLHNPPPSEQAMSQDHGANTLYTIPGVVRSGSTPSKGAGVFNAISASRAPVLLVKASGGGPVVMNPGPLSPRRPQTQGGIAPGSLLTPLSARQGRTSTTPSGGGNSMISPTSLRGSPSPRMNLNNGSYAPPGTHLPQFTDKIISIRPRRYGDDQPVWAYLRSGSLQHINNASAAAYVHGEQVDPSPYHGANSLTPSRYSNLRFNEDTPSGGGAYSVPATPMSQAGSSESRPSFLSTPSVKFLQSLENASSDEEEEKENELRELEEVGAEGIDGDWDALPQQTDLATTLVLSMSGANGPTMEMSDRMYLSLSKQRANLWSESRMLCFGLTAAESECVLRAFEAASVQGVTASMNLVESQPAFSVVIQSVPAAFAMPSANGRPLSRGISGMTTQQAKEDFAIFLSQLQRGQNTVEELITLLEEALNNSNNNNNAVANPTAGGTTPSRPSTTSILRNSSSAQSNPLLLSQPFNLFSKAHHKAQCNEVVERLRDRGVKATVCSWEEASSAPPLAIQPKGSRRSSAFDFQTPGSKKTSRRASQEPSHQQKSASEGVDTASPTLFSIHVRLTGAASFTDSLVKLVRKWMPSPPAVDYLISSTREWRAQIPEMMKFTPEEEEETEEETAPPQQTVQDEKEQELEGSDGVNELDTSGRFSTPSHAAGTDRPRGGLKRMDSQASLSREELDARAVQREIDRIKRWASSANVAIQFESPQAAAEEAAALSAKMKEAEEARRKELEDARRKELDEAASIAAELSAQVKQLQESLAEREAAVTATEAERESLKARIKEIEEQQTTLSQKTDKMSKADVAALMVADKAYAEQLHRKINVENRVFEETARRNLEKQRAIRAAENGLTPKKDKEKEKDRQAELAKVGFDGSASSGSIAPLFATEMNPELERKEQQRKDDEKKNAREMRAKERRPTLGQQMLRSELFTMNHAQMREFMEGVKDEEDHVVTPRADAPFLGPSSIPLMDAPVLPSGPTSDGGSNPFNLGSGNTKNDMIPLAVMKKAQSESMWRAAHLPNMLDDVRRASMIPGFHTQEIEAHRASAAAAAAAESSNNEGGDEKQSGISSVSAKEAPGGNKLVSYSSGQMYDKLTGVLVEDLTHMSIEERLARAQQRVEEVEYDDMYRRYLIPKNATSLLKLSDEEGIGTEKKKKDKDRERRKRSTMDGATFNTAALDGDASGGTSSAVVTPRRHKKEKRDRERDSGDEGATSPTGAMMMGSEEDTPMKRSKRKTMRSARMSKRGVSMDITSGINSVSVRDDSPVRSSSAVSSAKSKRSVDDLIYWVDIKCSAIELENPFLIGKPDPYVEVYRCRQYIWEKVASTEIVQKTTNAAFQPLLMSVDALCNMQLDRKIMFKVFTNNRGTGRTLIGELNISLTQIQENIGSKFPIVNAAKLKQPAYKQSGFLKFHHAELCVNSTKPTLIYPGPNVQNAAQPLFTKLTHCLTRIHIAAENIPHLSALFGKGTKPDPYLEVYHLLPDGTWDTSLNQPAAASASGGPGGCLYRTEPAYQTTRPRFPPFILGFHSLCYGDVNRLIRIKIRHKDTTLAWIELTLKEMYLAQNKKIPLRLPAELEGNKKSHSRAMTATGGLSALSTAAAASSSSSSDSSKSAGFLILKKVSVFSQLIDLPMLCSNAGVQRRAVKGISDLPLKQLIVNQVQAEREAAKGASAATSSTSPAAAPSANDDIIAAHMSSKMRRNVYRGLHYIRTKAAGKFFSAFVPVKQSLLQKRQVALLMGSHPRLGEDAAVRKHFLLSPLFDPQLIPHIFTYLDANAEETELSHTSDALAAADSRRASGPLYDGGRDDSSSTDDDAVIAASFGRLK